MNKNKIIFGAIGGILVVIIGLVLNQAGKGPTKINKSQAISVWTVGDDTQKFNTFASKYNELTGAKVTFDIKSFESYPAYFYSLMGALVKGQGPDLFVVNNNDGDFFKDNIFGLDPARVSVDEFRKNFDLTFQNDLIGSIQDGESLLPYVKGIPLGYKVPMTFFNFGVVRATPISTWSQIQSFTNKLDSEGKSAQVALGDGHGLSDGGLVFSQLLANDSLNKNMGEETSENILKNSSFFKSYYNDSANLNQNNFSLKSRKTLPLKDVDFFVKGQIGIIFGYPDLLEKIDAKIGSFNKNMFRGTAFPTNIKDSGNMIVDYNYFVVNKNTQNLDLALEILNYFASPEGSTNYLTEFDYYLPARIDLLDARLEQPLKPGYNIKYKDIYNKNLNYTSYNLINKSMYDTEISEMLDLGESDFVKSFDKFRKRLLCLSNNILQPGENTGSCE